MRRIVVLIMALFLCSTANAGDAGKLVVDRVWTDSIGSHKMAYALVTWENTSKQTFKSVTVQAIAYDNLGKKIDIADSTFYKSEYGPIKPGFKGTLKILVPLGNEPFDKMGVSVIARQ